MVDLDDELDEIDPQLQEELEKIAAATPPEQKQAELEAWRKWKETKDPASFDLLVRGYQPVFNKFYQASGRASALPKSAIMSRQLQIFVHALDRFDPSKAQLITHVTNDLKRTSRYVRRYQNIARIPEDPALKFGVFQSREKSLESLLGRSPTAQELADDLATSTSNVAVLKREATAYLKLKRKELSLGADFETVPVFSSDPVQTKIWHLHAEFAQVPEAQKFIEHKYGLFSTPQKKTVREIGDAMALTPQRARTVARQVNDRLEKMLSEDTSWRK